MYGCVGMVTALPLRLIKEIRSKFLTHSTPLTSPHKIEPTLTYPSLIWLRTVGQGHKRQHFHPYESHAAVESHESHNHMH
jgi:hypothetical protein